MDGLWPPDYRQNRPVSDAGAAMDGIPGARENVTEDAKTGRRRLRFANKLDFESGGLIP